MAQESQLNSSRTGYDGKVLKVGIDPELQKLLLPNAIMALTVHVLKDPRA
jgi:hypothetical protein